MEHSKSKMRSNEHHASGGHVDGPRTWQHNGPTRVSFERPGEDLSSTLAPNRKIQKNPPAVVQNLDVGSPLCAHITNAPYCPNLENRPAAEATKQVEVYDDWNSARKGKLCKTWRATKTQTLIRLRANQNQSKNGRTRTELRPH